MHYILFFLTISLVASSCFSQGLSEKQLKKEMKTDIELWHIGTIQIDSDNDLNGEFRYNQYEDILTFKGEDELKIFTAKNVMSFDFFDNDKGQRRFFISVLFSEEGNSTAATIEFFEVLKELKHFALLVKESYNVTDDNNNGSSGYYNSLSGNYVPGVPNFKKSYKLQKVETLYFFDDEGSIQPYYKIIQTKKLLHIFNKYTRSKMIDTSCPEKYMRNLYPQVKLYAKKNKLNFNRPDEFVKILNFYESQLESE